MILQCSHINKSFDGNTILDDISFHINEHEKTAIVGVNGSGKSTLLKILMQEYEADSGDVILQKDTVVGYLAQNQDFDSDKTIFEEMQDAKKEVIELEHQINHLTEQMNHSSGEALEKLIRQSDILRHRFEQLDGYSYQSELTGVLKGLGFQEEDFSKPVSTLSGGERTRAALGKMLLASPELIILDEPTNHLDINAVRWLENYLSSYRGAVIIVAHDRYFLDKIVSKVIEIRQHKCTVYQGNYSQFSQKKQALLDSQMKQYMNQQAQIKHQEAVIAKLKSFNREKSIRRAESREKALAKVEVLEKPVEDIKQMNFTLTPSKTSGNDVLFVENLEKTYDSHTLFRHLDMDIKRGEHVAIIGRNGTGKTTILKIINDLVTPECGVIKLGTNVEIGYYDQEHHVLHMDKTIFEEISDDYPDLTGTQIRNTLAAFLFTGDDVFKKIESLSGGERGRVSLAKLMLSTANFLILDEPTNHLDIASKEILEQALNHYEGTVLYVSHDRYFINQTAHRILDLENGNLVSYLGNYDYYLEKHGDIYTSSGADASSVKTRSNSSDTSAEASPTASEGKLNWQEQKELQAKRRKLESDLQKTETEISEIEERIETLGREMSDPKTATDAAQLTKLSKESDELSKKLEKLYETWETLSEEKETFTS